MIDNYTLLYEWFFATIPILYPTVPTLDEHYHFNLMMYFPAILKALPLYIVIALLTACSDQTNPIEDASGRYRATAETFNDRVWLIGGRSGAGGNDEVREILYSQDGVFWTPAISSVSGGDDALLDRQGHASLVFNNKLWVLAGTSGGSQRYNDVWSSVDGTNWANDVPQGNAPWQSRRFPGAFVLDEKMWLVAGDPVTSVSPDDLNDVWSSVDGISWTSQTLTVSDGLSFLEGGRRGFTVTEFDNKIWIIGGYQTLSGTTINHNDVWSSTNGLSWTRVVETRATTARFAPRHLHNAAALDGKLWVFAGEGDNDAHYNDVWSSTDGVTWVEATSSAPWEGRQAAASAVYQNNIWLMSGINQSNTALNDTWTSANGLIWSATQDSAPRFTDTPSNPSLEQNQTTTLSISAFDPEGSTITWSLSNDYGIVTLTSAQSSGTATATLAIATTYGSTAGINTVILTASDGINASTHALQITITEAVITAPTTINLTQSLSSTHALSFGNDNASWSLTSNAERAALSSTQGSSIILSINASSASIGVTTIVVQVTIEGVTYTQNIVLSINDPLITVAGLQTGIALVSNATQRFSLSATGNLADINWSLSELAGLSSAFTPETGVNTTLALTLLSGNASTASLTLSANDGAGGSEDSTTALNLSLHQWAQFDNAATGAPRQRTELVEFDNKLWILGGDSASDRNDVWSSTDGKTWTQVTSSANWSIRERLEVLHFDGKLWVLGGEGSSARLNDVWSSTNGASWTQVTSSANWTARRGHQAIVFDNKMWVIGGDASGDANDVWYSTDGASWTQATAAANWSVRTNFSAVSFNNKMWVIGGDTNQIDIWSSTNGVSWTNEGNAPVPAGEAEYHTGAVVTWNNQLWLLGGQFGTSSNNDTDDAVWYSNDGITWLQAQSDSPWSARRSHSVATLNDRLYLYGGNQEASSSDNPDLTSDAEADDIWALIPINATDIPFINEPPTFNTTVADLNLIQNESTTVILTATDLNETTLTWNLSDSNGIASLTRTQSGSRATATIAITTTYGSTVGALDLTVTLSDGTTQTAENFTINISSATIGVESAVLDLDEGVVATQALTFNDANAVWSILSGTDLATLDTTSGASIVLSLNTSNTSLTEATITVQVNIEGQSYTTDIRVSITPFIQITGMPATLSLIDSVTQTFALSSTRQQNTLTWLASDLTNLESTFSPTTGSATTLTLTIQTGANATGTILMTASDGADGAHDATQSISLSNFRWTSIQPNATGVAREYSKMLSFNDRLWIIGGHDTSERNDVWSSSDGLTWSSATLNAGWSGRYLHAAVAFNSKLWVMGGYDSTDRLNDIWSSTNGLTWIEEVSSAVWSERRGHQVLAYNNQLWLLGGDADPDNNDVWVSSNGVTWTTATDNAGWSARTHFSAAVFDDKMWVMGGDTNQIDVWSSTNGVNWVNEGNLPVPSGEIEYHSGAITAFNNQLWLLGGQSGSSENNDVDDRVWYSNDGVSWLQAANDSPWSDRRRHAASVLNGKLYLYGGLQASTNNPDLSVDALADDVWVLSPIDEVLPTLNEAPAFILSASDLSIEQNQSTRLLITVTEAEGTTVTWQLIGGSDIATITTEQSGINATATLSLATTYGTSIGDQTLSVVISDGVSQSTNAFIVTITSSRISAVDVTLNAGDSSTQLISFNDADAVWSITTGNAIASLSTNTGTEILLTIDASGSSDSRTTVTLQVNVNGFIYSEDIMVLISPPIVVTGIPSTVSLLPDNPQTFALSASGHINALNWSVTGFTNLTSDFNPTVGDNTTLSLSVATGVAASGTVAIEASDGAGGGIDRTASVQVNTYVWVQATSNAAWPARERHAMVTFNDRLWILGGNRSGIDGNDVWSSTNGITWSEATSNAAWPARDWVTAVASTNRIWVLGGDSARRNDVWSSTDGVTWTEITASASWGDRRQHRALYFDNKLWLFGGDANPDNNDVWHSTDGATWTEVTSAAAWSARANHRVAIFRDKLWLIGGDASGQDDVYSSTNGINWTLEVDDAPFQNTDNRRYGGGLQVINDTLWLFGGVFGNSTGRATDNDTWYSHDGITWKQAAADSTWSIRRHLGSTTLNGKVYLSGGLHENSSGDVATNDVWMLQAAE